MATGDVKNNLQKLFTDLKKMRVPPNLFITDDLASGNSTGFLRIFDFLLQWRNPALSHLINNKGLKPLSLDENKTKFLEGVYLIFRDLFNWKPPLTTTQFMSNGFFEKKVIMCSEVIKLVKEKDKEFEQKTARKPVLDISHSGLKVIFKIPKNQRAGIRNTDSKASISCTSKEQTCKQNGTNVVNHNESKTVYKHKTGNENLKKDSKVTSTYSSQEQFLKQSMTCSNFLANDTRLNTAEILPSDGETANSSPVDNSLHQQPANINSNKNPYIEDWDKFQCSILEKIEELETRLYFTEKKIALLEKQESFPETREDQNGYGGPNSHESC